MAIDPLSAAFLFHLRTERRLSGNTVESYGFDMRRFSSFVLSAKVPLAGFSRSHFLSLLSAPDGETPEGMRDKAMLELMYASGLRASEVVSLRMENVESHAGFLRVLGKGGKERVVPGAQSALDTLVGDMNH